MFIPTWVLLVALMIYCNREEKPEKPYYESKFNQDLEE